jgi:UDP-N-acetylglucosamine--N-acetylmuramyl-(pentapeptide) pyrophosphoryl-undecaprenol N-acetylglucosamine transferase
MGRPVVITGGGTGGHVFPMQAIAEALRAKGISSSELRYVGSQRGQERQLLGTGDIALTLLPGRGLRRSFRTKDVLINVVSVIGLVGAVASALVLLRKWRPAVVVSVGGYASFAVSFAAMCWRTPLVLIEFDATPGAVHRLVGRYATKRCCAFPSSGDNVVVTGTPLRETITGVDRSPEARRHAKAAMTPPLDEERKVVVVMTGSLGSTRVNRSVRELADLWARRQDRAIIHVTGRRDFDDFRVPSPKSDLDYRVIAFGDMVELWSVADVAICRAGAITVGELSALSIPSILVPLPGAPNDHQTKNAEALVNVGGARLLKDAEVSGAALGPLLDSMLEPVTLDTMAHGASQLAHRDAAGAIATVILDVRGDS